MDTNNKNDSETSDEEMEIPTQEATLALHYGFEEKHDKWVKNQARIDKYRITRRNNKAKEAMRKRIVRRNRKKTHSDYDSDDDSADYTTEEEKEKEVPQCETTTPPSTSQEENNICTFHKRS
jgi:hypothetical protein